MVAMEQSIGLVLGICVFVGSLCVWIVVRFVIDAIRDDRKDQRRYEVREVPQYPMLHIGPRVRYHQLFDQDLDIPEVMKGMR